MAGNVSVTKKSHSDEIKKQMQEGIETALEICGAKAQSYASKLCPVDTGRLRSSITWATSEHNYEGQHQQEAGQGQIGNGDGLEKPSKKTEVFIGTNVSYAQFIEIGRAGGKAKPFLRPAVENHLGEYEKIVKNELSK